MATHSSQSRESASGLVRLAGAVSSDSSNKGRWDFRNPRDLVSCDGERVSVSLDRTEAEALTLVIGSEQFMRLPEDARSALVSLAVQVQRVR